MFKELAGIYFKEKEKAGFVYQKVSYKKLNGTKQTLHMCSCEVQPYGRKRKKSAISVRRSLHHIFAGYREDHPARFRGELSFVFLSPKCRPSGGSMRFFFAKWAPPGRRRSRLCQCTPPLVPCLSDDSIPWTICVEYLQWKKHVLRKVWTYCNRRKVKSL